MALVLNLIPDFPPVYAHSNHQIQPWTCAHTHDASNVIHSGFLLTPTCVIRRCGVVCTCSFGKGTQSWPSPRSRWVGGPCPLSLFVPLPAQPRDVSLPFFRSLFIKSFSRIHTLVTEAETCVVLIWARKCSSSSNSNSNSKQQRAHTTACPNTPRLLNQLVRRTY